MSAHPSGPRADRRLAPASPHPEWPLELRAWRAQYRDPPEAASLGRQLVAEGRSADECLAGWCHEAFALARLSQFAASEQAISAAAALAEAQPAGTALEALIDLRNVTAQRLRRHKAPAQAIALLEQNLAIEAPALPSASPARDAIAAYRRCLSHTLAGMATMDLGRLDDTLRHFLMARHEAEHSRDPALLASASGNLSGIQADLMNLDDAAVLAAEAITATEQAGLVGRIIWHTARYNRCHIALAAGDGAGARAHALAMAEQAAGVPDDKRARYEMLWAKAAVACGDLPDAARLLVRSRRRWAGTDELLLEWSLARAMLDNRAGQRLQQAGREAKARLRFQRARQHCDAVRELTTSGGEEALPLDRMQLFEQGSLACEALGDAGAALVYARRAFAQYELLAGRSARARRITEESRLALQLERRSREEAVRRRQAAEEEQRRLAELNTALQQANQAKARFLAAASHDLRQPMHALALQSANLRAALNGPQGIAAASAAAQRLEDSVLALSAMFDALLDISMIESGGLATHRRAVTLRGLLLRLVEDHQAQADARGLRLALRLPASAAAVAVDTDPALLETMLRNLLSNALKYTRAGGVMLALRRRHGAAGQWRLQVIDTGIDPAWQQQVFDDFVQIDNPQRQRSQGLGLGLAIVRRLAALLGHPLRLRSVPGRGTCVSLGLQEATGGDAGPGAAEPAPEAVGALGALRGRRVAVVEDDPDARRALVDLLTAWQIDTVAAGDAEALQQALARAGTAGEPPVEALITDLRLPGPQDGLALAGALRAQARDAALPVLVLTADLLRPPAPEVDWLVKPAAAQALWAWLHQHLGRLRDTPHTG